MFHCENLKEQQRNILSHHKTSDDWLRFFFPQLIALKDINYRQRALEIIVIPAACLAVDITNPRDLPTFVIFKHQHHRSVLVINSDSLSSVFFVLPFCYSNCYLTFKRRTWNAFLPFLAIPLNFTRVSRAVFSALINVFKVNRASHYYFKYSLNTYEDQTEFHPGIICFYRPPPLPH